MITHLEPDILKCEVKWALGSISTNKASGGDGIPVELFQILKDDAVKVLHSICQQIWKLSSGHRMEKVGVHSNPKERQCQRMFKLLHNCTHLTPVLLPGKSHGRRSLVACSPWGCYQSDTTERLHFHFSLSCIGEGNDNPLQCSCLENPRDGGAWWAAVYGVAQSRTRLKQLSSSSNMLQSNAQKSPSQASTVHEP